VKAQYKPICAESAFKPQPISQSCIFQVGMYTQTRAFLSWCLFISVLWTFQFLPDGWSHVFCLAPFHNPNPEYFSSQFAVFPLNISLAFPHFSFFFFFCMWPNGFWMSCLLSAMVVIALPQTVFCVSGCCCWWFREYCASFDGPKACIMPHIGILLCVSQIVCYGFPWLIVWQYCACVLTVLLALYVGAGFANNVSQFLS